MEFYMKKLILKCLLLLLISPAAYPGWFDYFTNFKKMALTSYLKLRTYTWRGTWRKELSELAEKKIEEGEEFKKTWTPEQHVEWRADDISSFRRTALEEAVCNNNPEKVRRMLFFGRHLIEDKDSHLYYEQPIEFAFRLERREIMELFFQYGIFLKPYQLPETLGAVLVRGNDSHKFPTLEELQKYGYNLRAHANSFINHKGKYPLTIAIESGEFNLVHLMLDHGANAKEKSAITTAVSQNNLNIAKLLCKHGADAKKGDLYPTTLYHAKSCEMTQWLLEQGTLVNAQDKNGNTLLHSRAVKEENEKIVIQWLKGGADLLIKNKKGNTPLHCLVSAPDTMNEQARRRAKIVLFYAHKRNQLPAILQTSNKDGQTPIQTAKNNGNKDFAKFLEDCAQQKKYATADLIEIGRESEL